MALGGVEAGGPAPDPSGWTPPPREPAREPIDPPESDPRRSPEPGWRAWTAIVALLGGFVLATVFGLLVDVPALALGVKLTASQTPPGLAIADTFVQDVAFVLAAVYCARLGGRRVRSWQFGLRRPGDGWRSAALMIGLLIVTFLVLSIVWSSVTSPEKENLLKQLGSNEGTALLILSAGLTCVVAPICEETLFRGYIFTALRSWRGTLPAAIVTGLLFGAVHAGSAPALDLAPLALLGFGLCLLYRSTGSLYPGIIAHSINNSIAFASLEEWNIAQSAVLLICALLVIGALARGFQAIGLIEPSRSAAPATA